MALHQMISPISSSVFAKGHRLKKIRCRQQSDGIDSSASSAFHQQLVAVDRLEDAAKFLSLQGVKQSFAVYPKGPRVSSETYLPHRVYVAAMRSNLLAPLRRGMGGEAICRCRSEPGIDLSIHPHHPSNCSLNGKERTFRHSEVCRLSVKPPTLASLWSHATPAHVIPISLSLKTRRPITSTSRSSSRLPGMPFPLVGF